MLTNNYTKWMNVYRTWIVRQQTGRATGSAANTFETLKTIAGSDYNICDANSSITVEGVTYNGFGNSGSYVYPQNILSPQGWTSSPTTSTTSASAYTWQIIFGTGTTTPTKNDFYIAGDLIKSSNGSTSTENTISIMTTNYKMETAGPTAYWVCMNNTAASIFVGEYIIMGGPRCGNVTVTYKDWVCLARGVINKTFGSGDIFKIGVRMAEVE